jgi:hypothetical protein
MPDRSPSRRRLSILVAASISATGGAASLARAQQTTGSIGASLTILAPIAAQPRVIGFDLGRDGIVRIVATVPEPAGAQHVGVGAGGMSELVMARVSSAAVAFTTEAQPPAFPAASGGDQRLLHVVKLRRVPRALDTQRVELRVEYVIVAGT